MSIKLPLVSIVITSYNRECTIGKAIESALAQDYPNLEIIISENCSSDNSHIVISKYISDKRIKYYRNQENIGMLNNFKISFNERAAGDYITIVNSDDEFVNSKFISKAVELINKYNDVVIVKSGVWFHSPSFDIHNVFESYDEFYNPNQFLDRFNFENDFGWGGILLNREILNKMDVFETKIIGIDLLANIEMLLFGNIVIINELSYKLNIHNENASLLNYKLEQIELVLKRLKSLFINYKERYPLEFEVFSDKVVNFYLQNFLQYTYIKNRKDFNLVKELCYEFDYIEYKKIAHSLSFAGFKCLYFIPKIGIEIVKLKKRIIERKFL